MMRMMMFEAAGAEAIAGGVRGEWSAPGAVVQWLRGGGRCSRKAVALTERHTTQRRRRIGQSR